MHGHWFRKRILFCVVFSPIFQGILRTRYQIIVPLMFLDWCLSEYRCVHIPRALFAAQNQRCTELSLILLNVALILCFASPTDLVLHSHTEFPSYPLIVNKMPWMTQIWNNSRMWWLLKLLMQMFFLRFFLFFCVSGDIWICLFERTSWVHSCGWSQSSCPSLQWAFFIFLTLPVCCRPQFVV